MTRKNKWRIRVLFWIVSILIAAGIGAVCASANVSGGAFHKVLIAYVILMVAIWYAINMAYVVKLANKVNSLIPILYDEGDPERYLKELTGLIGEAKSSAFRSIYHINSAAAYCDMEEYEKAKMALESLDPKRIPGINKLAYYVDLALVNIHLEEDGKAVTIWNDHKERMMKFAEDSNLGPAIASLHIFSLIQSGREQEAVRELGSAKQKWKRKRDIKEFEYMESKLGRLHTGY